MDQDMDTPSPNLNTGLTGTDAGSSAPTPPGKASPSPSTLPPPPVLQTDQDPAPEPEPAPTKEGNHRPHTGRYQPTHPSYRLSRAQLREIAATTLDKLDLGYYVPPPPSTGHTAAEVLSSLSQASGGEGDSERKEEKEPDLEKYDLAEKIEWTNAHTEYWAPDAPELDGDVEDWSEADLDAEMEALSQAQAQSLNDDDEQAETKTHVKTKTRTLIKEYSTLVGARKLYAYLRAHPPASGNTTIGVLNFASAKKPGGGFINGAQAQEESIARTSTLYPSLLAPSAAPFYAHHMQNPSDAFYTHAMVYSPRVVLFRNDRGWWMRPVEVDVLTCAAVNAGEVRAQEEREREKAEWEEEMGRLRVRVRRGEEARARRREEERRGDGGGGGDAEEPHKEEEDKGEEATQQDTKPDAPPNPPAELSSPPSSSTPTPPPRTPQRTELLISSLMHTRIARLLALFQHHNTPHLILGSFGTGVFQNRTDLVARIFWDLIARKGARFEGVFESVVFAILGRGTVRVFREVFGVEGEGEEGDSEEEEEEEGREEDVGLPFDLDGSGVWVQHGAAGGDDDIPPETQMTDVVNPPPQADPCSSTTITGDVEMFDLDASEELFERDPDSEGDDAPVHRHPLL